MPNLDRSVALLGADGPVGAALSAGLRQTGHHVSEVDDRGMSSGEEIAAAIRGSASASVAAVIDAGFVRMPPAVGELATIDPAVWVHEAEQPMRRALHVLQAAHACLADSGGRIVVVLPSLVMSGSAGVVGWSAAAEGYRSLVKAAARAWGSDGVTLKSVLVPIALITDDAIDRPGLQPPALGNLRDLMADLAPAVAALLDERLDAVTGLTVAVDGGVWMTS